MDRRRRAARTVALMSLFTMTDTHTDVPIASFDGDGSDIISLIVGIDPVQAGSGDPSPDNVRPISGWTGAKVTRTGKNLFDINTIRSTAQGMTVTIDGQTVKVDGTSSASGRATLAEFQFLKAGTYHLHTSGDLLWLKAWSSLGADATVTVDDISVVYRLATTTLTSGTEYHLTATENQIEIGSSFSAYEPYAGNTYTIALGDTVYGGTLDVTTGKLTVDRAMVDLGSLNWTKSNTSGGNWWFSTNKSDAKRPASNHDYPNVLCSQYKKRTPSQLWGGNVGVGINYSSSYIVVVDSNYSDATAFKTAMDGVQLVYELATPIVYDLTPTEVSTLIGTNNIWADTGDIKYIEYNI